MSTTLTAEAADEIQRGLDAVRQQAGLASGEAHLMRYTINAVYRIGDRVLRLSHGEVARERARRVVRAMALLTKHEVPTVELDTSVEQPVVVNEWVATVWHYIPHPTRRPDPVELAEPLARLHAIAETPSFLPRWSPVATARRRLAGLASLPADELLFTQQWASREVELSLDDLVARLQARCENLEPRVAAATWELPIGVVHGDAHVGNVLAGRLCDFDSLAIGPREWDLVPLVHSAIRFGDPSEPYERFAAAYGFDLATSPSWPLLREVRELQLVTSVMDKLPGRPEVAQTLGHRLRTYLAGDNSAVWQRYR
ncbi:aminoglycoside phosphotransferase family protein [Verrucosispora sp. CWR15]|uniref:Aminoglycoside phosphotransferase family protein n=2 Tax=Verrucosispora sioxanthis TaxID=2499994 RepID=A0A6M1L4P8_9ACTN|nr:MULTISPECIES: aminoglycoside phosphotransferase family protein [Micromonospora]NEE65117.1 aminoglycoside phosphotransferase family protein [Verrucosispora sioxanthis]NGM14227.1 aminoglycoside phosphotransferase family protein [Verrucosispora sioxanthis]WBB53854.1 aminoglycoside phosphotransferase family protein [Verrucosispora sp. WMMD573]